MHGNRVNVIGIKFFVWQPVARTSESSIRADPVAGAEADMAPSRSRRRLPRSPHPFPGQKNETTLFEVLA